MSSSAREITPAHLKYVNWPDNSSLPRYSSPTGLLREGDRLNCERAMSGKTRFGGHMVQGHVDGQATIISKIPDGNSIRYTFRLSPTNPTRLEPYLIEKGYVTVDGASLTLTEVNGDQFGIMLIAHSQSMLTLTNKEVGDTVNIEVGRRFEPSFSDTLVGDVAFSAIYLGQARCSC